MRHLYRLFLIAFLLAGLSAAPVATFASPLKHAEMTMAMMTEMGATLHVHHKMMQGENAQPIMPPAHHADHAAACAAWCAGAFLTTLPEPSVWPTAMPSLDPQPALAERLAGLAPSPPLEPPKPGLS